MKRLKATVAYNGSRFHGFAVNDDVRTVAGDLEAALSRVTRGPVTIVCAGRTDRGVHGRGQVISFDVGDKFNYTLGRLQSSINQMCGPEISIRDLEEVPADFHARFSAHWRRYRYKIWNRYAGDPLLTGLAWHIRRPLNVDHMNAAAAYFIGEQDFASFCRRPKAEPGMPEHSLVREVIEAEWTRGREDPELLTFEIRASSFCHQMVRAIVGTLVEVGLGEIEVGEVPKILAAKDRTIAGAVAPPQGLTFWDVGY